MMEQAAYLNPVEKKAELLKRLERYSVQEHTSSHEGYGYLQEGTICIVVKNPHWDCHLFIELEEQGEFTLCFASTHCHYSPCQEDYEEMLTLVEDILENRLGCATLLYGQDNQWLASRWVEPQQIGDSVKKTFDFTFKQKEFRQRLQKQGGQVRYEFWNPADNKATVIPPMQP